MKNRMRTTKEQVFADSHFDKYESALSATASFLSYWYSGRAEDVLEFMSEAGWNHGTEITRQSKTMPTKLISLTYWPPYEGNIEPVNENRWILSVTE